MKFGDLAWETQSRGVIQFSGVEEKRLATQGISPRPISDRLMSMCIQLKGVNNLTLISICAPTMQTLQEEKEEFYEKLGSCASASEMDSVIILDDFNARVGSDWKSWPSVIGKRGVGKTNFNSLMLLEFCTRFQLSLMGTMFQLKDSLKNT